MTFTDEKSLLSYLTRLMVEKEIDFVAHPIISHWHAIGVDALVYSISQKKNEKPSGVVVIEAHVKDGFVISERDFICQSFATVKFCFLDFKPNNQTEIKIRVFELFNRKKWNMLLGIKNIRKVNKGGNKELRIACPVRPNIGFLQVFRDKRLADKYYPVFSLLDEGLGSYVTDDVWNLLFKIHNQYHEKEKEYFGAMRVLRKITTIASNRLSPIATKCTYGKAIKYFDEEAAKYINAENLFLFRKEHGKLLPNKPVVESYRKVIEKRGKLHERIEKTRPLAIVVTQPFAEYGQIPLTDDLALIGSVINVLVGLGFDILLKPHPREMIGKYDSALAKFESDQVSISRPKMPVEELYPALDPACVIGFTSTTLAVASAMYDITVITIVDMLFGITDDEYIKVHGTEFKILTREIVYNADTLEKLKQILDSVKSSLEKY